MSAEIRVTREPSRWRDRLRSYKLVVDGSTVASLKEGDTGVVTVGPGAHRVWMKIDWCRSSILDVEMEEGGTASFTCRPNGSLWMILLYATVLRKRYLVLEPRSG